MARALKDGEKVVGRTCHYVRSDGHVVPAVITALGAGDAVNITVFPRARAIPETYTDAPLMVNQDDVSCWYAGSRRRYD